MTEKAKTEPVGPTESADLADSVGSAETAGKAGRSGNSANAGDSGDAVSSGNAAESGTPVGKPAVPRIDKNLWRKARRADTPRVVVIGVLRDDAGRLLTSTFRDGVSGAVLHRPPGGGVHFGERLADALERELVEELGQPVTIGDRLGVFEDLFTHEDAPGHEIVFAYAAEFQDRGLHGSDDLTLIDDGLRMPVGWHPVESFAPAGPWTLCPPGLAELLTASTGKGGQA